MIPKPDSRISDMLNFKRQLLETYLITARNFTDRTFAQTANEKAASLLQKIGIVLAMKGSFECAAHLYQLDQLQSRQPIAAYPNDPLDNQNIEILKNSIQVIDENCQRVSRQANQLLAYDTHLYGKECIALEASQFRLENQIDELLHMLLQEYNKEVKAMRHEADRQQHRRHLAKAFLLVDPSTELDFKSSLPSEYSANKFEPENFFWTSAGIEPNDALVDKLLRKLNSIQLFNKY